MCTFRQMRRLEEETGLGTDWKMNGDLPFEQAKTIGIAGCPVNALRVAYIGELGWEAHLPVKFATTVYAALHEAGAAQELVNAGYRAIETLQLKKGYWAWPSDTVPITHWARPVWAGHETIYRNNDGVARTYILDGEYESKVVRVHGTVSLAPLFDPKMERVKV